MSLEQEPCEVQIEYRVDSIIRELDDICSLATQPETAEAVERNKIGIGQIMTRAQLIMSFILARQPSQFKVISNGR